MITKPPLIQLGFSTPTFCAPNTDRTSCISIKLTRHRNDKPASDRRAGAKPFQ